jgi:hypothetical protein
MCAVSMITGHYQGMYPDPYRFPPQEYPNYAELVRKARLYDEMMRQKDCPAPAKDAWHKELEGLMREKYGLEPKTP